MPLFVGEFRTHKCLYQVLRQGHANDAGTKHQNVDIVVLNALMRGISVMAHSRTNTRELVGGNAGTDAAAADEHTPFGFAVEDSAAHGFSEIGIVGGIFVESADVEHVVAHRAQHVAHGVFELKAGVVGTNHNLHAGLTFPGLL